MKAYYYIDPKKPLPEELRGVLKKQIGLKDLTLKNLRRLVKFNSDSVNTKLHLLYINHIIEYPLSFLLGLNKLDKAQETFDNILETFKDVGYERRRTL